ncbi:transglycosylase domain-containing protein [Acuticoccus sp. I52.16.1]|uniref:transglycosylase domain-containing protein n=1 Tax=Acuticoccus sp. I52.16.1 TaxID=2928472 RepID=UPI001FD2A2B0|nr:transglycosylase domain-containing protein [Acuticoccus sp. I52.16.1]UOM33539.1 PBP1A family penicillin-binding protein [Acuticoccus sp. I52.16.1]
MKDAKPRGALASGRNKSTTRVAPRFGEDTHDRSPQASDPPAGAKRRADPERAEPRRGADGAPPKRAPSGATRSAGAASGTPSPGKTSSGKTSSGKAPSGKTAATAKAAAPRTAAAKSASGTSTAKAAKAGAVSRSAGGAGKAASAKAAAPAQAAAAPRRGRAEPVEREAAQQAASRRRAEPKRRSRGERPRRRRFSLLRFAFRMTFTLALLGVVGVGAIIAYYAATLPPVDEWAVPERPPNVAILSEGGELIANRGDTGGRAVKLADLPPYVPQAVIAIEDRRYYSHPGVDPIGLARAMVTNLTSGRLEQGGSTLTQQLAKNMFLTPSRTIERKIQEMVFAVWLEMKYSKDEILEMYLNRVYLGAGATGIDGAARRYFDRPAEELTLAQAAMIAGLLKAPTYYAPTNDLARARGRGEVVLAAMRDVGFISGDEYTYAVDNPASVAAPKVATSGGYVADWVAEVLPGFAGSLTSDIVVETTINLELQDLAQSALQDVIAKEGEAKGVSQGAVVVLDGSGAVKALVGGRKYAESQYNRAVSAHRQPGSSFKPFVYLAALEHGLTPYTMRIDQPTRIGDWEPENYNRKYLGPVSLTRALALSLNTIAAQLTAEVGPKTVADVAHRLGIRSEMAPNASIALGTSEVTLLELTTAYVPFSNGGIGVVPHVVRRIKTADGQMLYERRGGGPGQVVSLEHVGQMNTMLHAALTSGTAHRAAIDGWQAAGKTGTSQAWRDAWFVGYTAFFTAGVWLGNDDNSSTKKATGGSLPAELWKTLMNKVQEGMVPADLPGMDQLPEPIEAAPDDYEIEFGQPVAAAPQQLEQQRQIRRGRDDWIRPAPQQDNGRGFFGRLFGG